MQSSKCWLMKDRHDAGAGAARNPANAASSKKLAAAGYGSWLASGASRSPNGTAKPPFQAAK
jgi:hypothetical protein